MTAPGRREWLLLVAILSLASVLLFLNLGSPRLWQDEAETALLARNVLKFGVPRVWDGQNLAAQYYDLDYNAALIFQKSWLPIYLVSASMMVFGEGTLAARLPFALCGFAAVFLTWRVARRLSGDGTTGLLAAFLLAVSLAFLTYSRQCRWYALAMAATLLIVEAEDRLDEKRGWIFLGFACALLFHTNYLVLMAFLPALLLARAWTRGFSPGMSSLAAGLAVAAALSVPFWFFFPPFGFASQSADVSDLPHRVLWVLGDLNRYALPFTGIVVMLALAGRGLVASGWFRRISIAVLVAVPLSCLTMWTGLVELIGFRYAVPLLPLGAILLASVMRAASRKRPLLLAGLVAAQLMLHLGFPLSLWPPVGQPGLVRTDLVDFWTAIVHPVKGPIDGAVDYLLRNARPGDLLYTPYEQLPLQFYTSVRTVSLPGTEERTAQLGIELPQYVSHLDLDTINWYLPRRDWAGFLGAPSELELLRLMEQQGKIAERIVLDAPDLTWQMREYPPAYYFRAPAAVPPVILYRFR